MSKQKAILDTGDQIGGYTVTGMLGKGGFGITYLAQLTNDVAANSDEPVTLLVTSTEELPPESSSSEPTTYAIKEFFPADVCHRSGNTVQPRSASDDESFQQGKKRFLDEARIVQALQHPHIVECIDVIEENNTVYMIMPYYEGQTLSELLKQFGKLDSTVIEKIFNEIGSALEYIHGQKIYHRDIKPSNIYYARGENRYILLDFGAARQRIADVSRSFTAVLTEGYAPFEQYTRNSEQDQRTDYYALGATLHHCITGERPPSAADRIANDRMPKLATLAPKGYSLNFLNMIDDMLAVTINDRSKSLDVSVKVRGDSGSPSAAAVTKVASAQTQVVGKAKQSFKRKVASDPNAFNQATNHILLFAVAMVASFCFFLPSIFWEEATFFSSDTRIKSLILYLPGHLILAAGITFMTGHVRGTGFSFLGFLITLLINFAVIEVFATYVPMDKPVANFQWVIWGAGLGLVMVLSRKLFPSVGLSIIFGVITALLLAGISLLHYGVLIDNLTSDPISYLWYFAISYGLVIFAIYVCAIRKWRAQWVPE